jgi:photosystem II stability/assembly factor-like uncharacterized protein
MTSFSLLRRLGVAFIAATAATVPIAAQGPNLSQAVRFREIGPTRQGGRYVDFAVVEATPRIFYAATGSGGLWKTINSGITFEPVFDNQPVVSIGAVAVAQSDPNVVYVGTGEANNSRSTYYGDGVYKSTDAGATWKNVGLPNSGHIGRIVVNPTNPNIVFVAALGHLYSENPDRGLYRSADGGTTWTKVIDHKVDGRSIGVVDVVMNPRNPNELYAATYDKVRRPWSFGEGGPGTAVFKSTNGGTTWTQVTNGLPTGLLGRIGIAYAYSDPKTVYLTIENANAFTGDAAQRKARMAQGFGGNTIGDELYRTDDAGKTFRKIAGDTPPVAGAGGRGAANATGGRGGGGRGGADSVAGGGGRGGGRGAQFGADPPYYYAQIRVDPQNKEHLYQLGVSVTHSTDGGRTWSSPFNFGGDNHALWINPKDPNHMLLGYDHGMGVTYDAGRNWLHPDNIPLAQFYAISVDNEYPYNIYGGLQDNGSVKGPSSRRSGGIPFEAWYRTGGGDGMFNAVDWKDSRWLYNESQFGPLQRVDQKTGDSKSIRYSRPNAGGGGGRGGGGGTPACADPNQLRWNWAAPILVSPHNSDVIYHAANILLRSPFRGETWQEISPDLTVNDEAKRCGTGNIQYATITTIDESPIVPGLLWVGTDDGNVQVSRNGGATWTNVRSKLPGHPGYWVSRVSASHFDPAVAYVSVTGLRNDDFKPYIWKTTDYGQTWTSIAGNLPNFSINVVREDHKNPNLLFVGNDMGVFATIDGGRAWTRLNNGLPTNPVHDLVVRPRENELVVATHGRGIYIADIVPLQGLNTQAMSSDVTLFDIQPTVQWETPPEPVTASLNYNGQSRPSGVPIHYYLRSAVQGGVTVRVYDGGRMIAETSGPGGAGVQTVRWNMQQRREVSDAESAGRGGGGGRGGRGGGGGGRGGRGGGGGGAAFPVAGTGNVALTNVQPGEYRVELQAGNTRISKNVLILEDHWAK